MPVGFAPFGWFFSIKIQNFLQPWWRNSKEMSAGFAPSGWFQSIKIQNFLQPWWRIFRKMSVGFFKYREGILKKLQWVSLILGDSEYQNLKFSSTMVKEFQKTFNRFSSFWVISEHHTLEFELQNYHELWWIRKKSRDIFHSRWFLKIQIQIFPRP